MNPTIKALNDALVQLSGIAEVMERTLHGNSDQREYIRIALRDASDALAGVMPQDHLGNTWSYQGGGCEGGQCGLKQSDVEHVQTVPHDHPCRNDDIGEVLWSRATDGPTPEEWQKRWVALRRYCKAHASNGKECTCARETWEKVVSVMDGHDPRKRG